MSNPAVVSLYFTSQPASGSGASVCASTVTVKALKPPIGQITVDTSFTSVVTFTLIAQSGSGTLTTTTCTASAGVCSTNSCPISGYGTFILMASSGSHTPGYSQPFTITSGAVSTITLNAVTSTVYRGQTFTVTGYAKDSNGIYVSTSTQFYLAVSSGPGSIVSGSSAIMSSGLVTFSNVVVSASGSYVFTVSCPSCTSPTVNTISVTVHTYGLLVIDFPNGIVEGAANQYYTLKLSTQPSANVAITVSSADSVLSVDTTTLTFTTANYATAQTVYFDVENIISTSNPYSVLVSHTITSTDYTYAGTADMQSCMISSGSINIPIYGYQEKSINVDVATTVAENSQVLVTVSLGSAPTYTVTISLSSSSTSISLSATKLIFTTSNWAAQQYSITGPASGTIGSTFATYTVTYSVSSQDSSFTSASTVLRPSPLTTTVIVTPGVSNSIQFDTSNAIVFTKNFNAYFVRLSGVPSSTVTVNVNSGSSNVVVSPTTLTFLSSTSTIFQEVKIYAANTSPSASPAYTVSISHSSSSSDLNFNGLSSSFTVTVVNVCLSVPYDWPNADKCTCPNGFNCKGYTPTPCPAGTYNSGSTSCTKCPAGSSCVDPTVSPVACAAGTYSYDYYIACYPCPPGYICPSQNGYLMKRCVQGTYAGPGSTSCTTPSSGSMAPSPEYALAITCPTGYYTQGAQDMCGPCPAGFSCSGTTQTACTAGTYSLPGMGVCTACPNDHECDPAMGPTRICPEGTYRASGSYTCGLCPAGSYCSASQSSRPTTCATGYTSIAGASYCTSSSTWGSYPGLTFSSNTVGTSSYTPVTNFLGSYTAFSANVMCLPSWGRCYTIPGGQTNLNPASPTFTSVGYFSFVGSGTSTAGFNGFNIPAGSDRPDVIGFECQPGYYCPNSVTSTQCGAGTFNPTVRAVSSSSCFSCPVGYVCDGTAIIGDYEIYPCPGGSYCAVGTSSASACPAGYFRNNLRGIAPGSCELCPDGYYCSSTGTTNPTLCPRGNICPLGTKIQYGIRCPEGTYNLFYGKYKIEDCILCPAGSYCPLTANYGAITPIWCVPGTYNPYQGLSTGYASSNCFPCTAGYACIGFGTVEPYVRCQIGYYCPEGSNLPIQQACPPGTVGTLYGAYSKTQCDKCPPGFYCGFATNYVNNPPTVCPAGYYCPIATEFQYQYPCPAGTYNPSTRIEGIHECLTCPVGSYCPSSTVTPTTCPAGYYCPLGTSYSTAFPCPAGTYRSTTGGRDQGDCSMCTTGHYCPLASTAVVSCPAGTYMDELGASDAGPGTYPACKPCPAGYYSSSAGAVTCTAASPGYYTYQGATSQTYCVIGYFCAGSGTSEYVMYSSPCPPGYLCVSGSYGLSAYPTYNSNACPTGYYCTEGANAATPCPAGYYRNTKGARSVYDCAMSPAGYYVSSAGTSDYSPYPCAAGYYCPAGSTTSTPNPCPKGTYRSLTGGRGASDCAACTPGYYCPNTGMTTPTSCPATQYCPSGTITPIQCPAGTYSTSTNLKTSSDCTPCDHGKYCAWPGLSTPTGSCYQGYYCISGSTLQAPTDGVTGALCPAGGYCPTGTTTPSNCTAGTFNNFVGGWSSADCVACWPGYYCVGDNNPSPTAQCAAGYYCTGSSSSSQQNAASAGYYAPLGSVAQIPCLQGTYNPSTAQSACLSCPAGAYCPSTAMSTLTSYTCTAGYYCIQGAYVQSPCPSGTFTASTGLQSVDQCSACTGGSFCQYYGLNAVSGSCNAGYYCTSGAFTSTPGIDNAGFYGRCAQGSYCLAGSSTSTSCPAGTYNPTEGAELLSGCANCPAGYACPNNGTVMYSLQCRRGYYCGEGSTTNEPATTCTAGYYCPTGSAVPLQCPAGTYQTDSSSYSCSTCPPGYYCPINTSSYTANLCPVGYYCPSGTTYGTQYPCPAGTFNPLQGQQIPGACQSCSPGSYCNSQGASAVTGSCSAGFYCGSGSTVARPTLVSMGGSCTSGSYCPAGSTSVTVCDPGYYCPDDQMSTYAGPCAAGYYCISGATTPTPTDGSTGNVCPQQYYCPSGSSTPTQCPTGYFIPYTGASSSSECITCTPGYYCDGDTVTPLKDCPIGYYCPGGDTSPTYQCDRGYMCPLNSDEPILCPAGTYQPDSLQGSCITCSAGYYCALGAYTQTLCPKGYYCPTGTQYALQYPCPVGTYNSNIGMTSISNCTACGSGKYCSSIGANAYTSLCDPGYYCTASAIVSAPTDGTTGNICPLGTYCPQGSGSPTSCDPGMYCNQYALSNYVGTCLQGYYCISKATTPTPTDGTTGNICPSGSYCPAQSSQSQACPPGTYGPSQGLSSLANCLNCNYGTYCSTSGLSAPQGTCSQGYYCNPGQDSATPVNGICPLGSFCDNTNYLVSVPCFMGTYNTLTGQASCTTCPSGSYCTGSTASPQKCPKGYQCPSGTRFDTEFPCGPGFYSSVTGNAACSICPAGYFCNNAAQTPDNLCPTYKYCPQQTGYGILCPPGTYNKDYQGLTNSSQCTMCPAGSYCVDGTISGQCAPGFWCKGGSPTATPVTTSATGQPCPPGYYCLVGTVTPTLCPDGKFRKDPGAMATTDCTSCPPGYYCQSGNTTPIPCPAGNYCPVGVQAPIPCPIRTYNSQTGGDNPNYCKICPAGYYCYVTGISTYTNYLCKPGYFCVQGSTGPINCPPGTYTESYNAGSINDCLPCPGGFYCPANTTNVISCPLGTYCPGGNSFYWLCPPGYICEEETVQPLACPNGYYCPLYNVLNVSINMPPILCDPSNLCPGQYFDQATCRIGYYYTGTTCKACPPGYYSDGRYSVNCKQCNAGYICTGGATVPNPTTSAEGGYACPAGYYCPLGSLSPVACPYATYNPDLAATSINDCLLCPNGTYGDTTGESKCKPCGSYADSNQGSLTCTCLGKFRTYQKYDGSCICLPTYEYLVNGVSESNTDSNVDCTPVQYTNCQNGQIRKADGSCTSASSCETQCNGGTGKYNSVGVCVCDSVTSEDSICNSDCIKNSVQIVCNPDGSYSMQDPSGENIVVNKTSSNYLSNTNCTGNSKTLCVTYTSNGPQATYGVCQSFLQQYYTNSLRRRLDATSAGISNALACVTAGSTFVFSLNPKNNFPVYSKNSLLNTNKNFDYAAFQELAWRMQSSESNVDTFGFTFTEPGIYDFVDHGDADQHIIIVVKAASESCPDPTKVFYARTLANIEALGLMSISNLITSPQWGIIAGIMVATFIVLLVLIAFLAFLHWRAWATSHARERLLKLVKDCCKRCRISRTQLVSPLIVEDESDSIDIDKDLLEPSQFTDMLQKLTRYYNQLQAAFDSQDEEARRSLEDLLGQAKDLKIMLGDRLSDVDPVLLRQKIKEANLESSEDDENNQIPEMINIGSVENVNIAMNAFVDLGAEANAQRTEELYRKIENNPDLLEKDKEELIAELNANMQTIEKVLDRDLEQAQNDINRRLQERANRRKAAEREKAYFDPKRNEIVNRCKKEKEDIEKQYENQSKLLENEFIEERDRIKKENRKEIDEKLKAMRTQLQNDLMSARNQGEIDNLMKIFEIESKRIEDQVYNATKQQESELLKRLEERRRKRLAKIESEKELKKNEIEARMQEEIDGLEQRALIAIGKVSAEVQLDMHEEQLIIEVTNNYDAQIADINAKHEEEVNGIDQEIQAEEKAKLAEREKLQKMIKGSVDNEEKERLMKALEDIDGFAQDSRLKQEDNLKAKLLERKRKRAEKEAILKAKRDEELKEIELRKHNAEKELRSNFELKKMEEILANDENHSPEELIAMARDLLEKKHDRETAELTGLKHSKLRERQNQLVQTALQAKTDEKAAQRALFEQSKAGIMKEKIDPQKKKEKIDELESKLQEAETQIDYNFIIGINSGQEKIWREAEDEFKQRFIDLANEQTKEIQEIMSKIKGADSRMLDANIADMEKEISQQKAELERKHAEKLRELDKKALEIKEIEKQKLVEIDFINSQLREVEEKQRRLDEVQEQRRVMEERQKKVIETMKERGISQEKMEELLKQHQEEMNEWEKAMENERVRQQQKLQAKLDMKKQKYQDKIASQIQKYKEENLKLIEQQEEAEQNKMKIVFDCGKEIKIWTPKVQIETKLRFPDFEQENEIAKLASTNLLDEVVTRVRRVEKIAENIDSKQFNLLMKAFSDISEMMDALKNRV